MEKLDDLKKKDHVLTVDSDEDTAEMQSKLHTAVRQKQLLEKAAQMRKNVQLSPDYDPDNDTESEGNILNLF